MPSQHRNRYDYVTIVSVITQQTQFIIFSGPLSVCQITVHFINYLAVLQFIIIQSQPSLVYMQHCVSVVRTTGCLRISFSFPYPA